MKSLSSCITEGLSTNKTFTVKDYEFSNPNRTDTQFFDKLSEAISKHFNKRLYVVKDNRSSRPSGSTVRSLFNTTAWSQIDRFSDRRAEFYVYKSESNKIFIYNAWHDEIITDSPKELDKLVYIK